ncbi:translocation/assembly module TamB domain-containing protein [Alsobacter sp. SYSU M60028]|uniref:Translocation/assembly module TamB domain-containing protein n=1 Tax=Alsobacter ponti TaxID=2962936 RepID=A0ABT1L9U6_9HYPH|nr:translocation/assembly module TamB domain-containing protein [Alsobacter ponti]MCP8937871.1 translocation/assembly module TamB domain-containing protein [Alsobacter ponti]
MARLRRILSGSLAALAVLAVALAYLAGSPGRAQSDQGTLAGILSWALSTPENRVTIGQVEGALSSDAVIRDVRIADREGVWLSVDRARLVWSRTALFSRRLQIDTLEIDRMTIARRPVAEEEAAAAAADAPALPELPVKIVVGAFAMKELALGEPVLGTAARIAAQGSAVLGNPAEGLSLKITANRLDAPGRFAVALGYVPQTTQLDLGLNLDEPAGGLLSRLANLPGTPPIRLRADGSGPLDGWTASLDFDSGPDVGAQGRATVNREAAGRRVQLALDARIENLLPPVVGPIFAGTTQLAGDLLAGDDGALAVRRLEVSSRTARLSLTGTVDPVRDVDLALSIRALPTDGTTTRAGAATIGRLVLDASARGPVTAPRIEARLSASDLSGPDGRFGSVEGTFSAAPPAGGGPGKTALTLDLAARGVALADPALARAVGGRLDIAARGALDAGFVLDLEQARVATETAQAQFAGRVGRRELKGEAQLTAPDLTAFSGVAGRDLRGAARLKAGLDGNPSRYTVRADLDGEATGLSLDIPRLDPLFAGSVRVQGVAARVPGGYAFETFRLAGRHITLSVDGRATEERADLTARLDIPDLARADERLSGRAAGEAKLTGSLRKPDVAARFTLDEARMLGRPVPRLAVEIAARDVTGALDATISASGLVDGKTLRGQARLAGADGGLALQGLDVSLGSVRAAGSVRLDARRLAQGELSVTAGDLDDIAPLILVPAKGSLDAKLALSADGGRQNVDARAKADRLAVGGVMLRRLDGQAVARDIYGAFALDASVTVERLVAVGQSFDTIRLTSRGGAGGSDVALTARGLGFDLDASGRVAPGPPIAVTLAAFSARRNGTRIALQRPATIRIDKGEVATDGLVLEAGTGRIELTGRAGRDLALTLDAKAVPLSLASLVAPDLGLEGRADAHVGLNGPASSPTGDYRLAVAGLAARATRDAGLPPGELKASGRLAGGRATVDASLALGRIGVLRATGSAPLGAGALDLRLSGPLDLAVLNTMLASGGQQVTGRMSLDLTATGTLAKPRLGGSATLSGGTFTDALVGIRLQGIEGRFAAQGEAISVERLTATTANGGTLQASGRVQVDPGAGFPADLRIVGTRAQVLSSDVVSATANLDLRIAGPVARTPRVSGRVDIIAMDVAVPDRLPETLAPLPGTRHIRPGPEAAKRLAMLAKARAARAQAPFVIGFDLAISAQNRIFVRGRGLNAELGGGLRLTGTSRDPVAVGAFELRRGEIDLAGQRIDLVRGRLAFTGDLTPTLDFLAQTQAAEVTAQISITGPATQPSFVISSQPGLPQDEVLSRILFGRAAGGLTGLQALQLAQTVAQLAGGAGPGGFEALRRSLGVDSLDVTSGASGGPAVGAARYLNRNVRVGVKAGADPRDTGIGVDVDVTRHLKLRGQIGADGSTSVGGAAEWEY